MFEKVSYIFAIALGLSAVISPIFTTYLNNKHQLRIKQIDVFESKKSKAINDFLECCYNLKNNYNDENFLKCKLSIVNLGLYISNDNRDILNCMIDTFNNKSFPKDFFYTELDKWAEQMHQDTINDFTSKSCLSNVKAQMLKIKSKSHRSHKSR
ncbi:MAG: hypothetical protein Q4D02_01760 [Clostridia bacterium]|nr:hypothetical protein [Clostridia bacterium]